MGRGRAPGGAGGTDRLRRVDGPAWGRAIEAAAKADVGLRPLTSLDDADAILRVMMATWQEAIPRETIRALAGSGNVPWGAFDGDELIGYVLGWAAVSTVDGLHEHSHMLAALPDRRHVGVGYALKLAQRASCLDRGIHLVRWTFDPLVARNAHLNINKLGATCDLFHRDYYGQMPDAINAGDRSDRLVVRWSLDADPTAPTIPCPRSWAIRTEERSSACRSPAITRLCEPPTRRSARRGAKRSAPPSELAWHPASSSSRSIPTERAGDRRIS